MLFCDAQRRGLVLATLLLAAVAVPGRVEAAPVADCTLFTTAYYPFNASPTLGDNLQGTAANDLSGSATVDTTNKRVGA